MRFALGLAIGFGVGFAGALLFAPGNPARASFDSDHNIMSSVKRAVRSVQDQVNEALEEAKKAQSETERQMRARYERTVREPVEETAKDKKRKVKEQKGK